MFYDSVCLTYKEIILSEDSQKTSAQKESKSMLLRQIRYYKATLMTFLFLALD